VEAVNYWQSALEPDAVNVKPVYLNASAEYVNAESAVKVEGVVGVLIDRDAAGYNLADDDLVSSPYNAKGQYYNLFNHVRIQLQNDLTEKAVVFCIGEGGGGGGGAEMATVTIENSSGVRQLSGALEVTVGDDKYSVGAYPITNGTTVVGTYLSDDGSMLTFGSDMIGADIDVAVTGDAVVSDNSIVVTGDCTLTVTRHSN